MSFVAGLATVQAVCGRRALEFLRIRLRQASLVNGIEMWRFGIAASLLRLGASDFSLVVDSSVVMFENCARHLGEPNPTSRSRLEIVHDTAIEDRGPTRFGELIIMIIYLPILTLGEFRTRIAAILRPLMRYRLRRPAANKSHWGGWGLPFSISAAVGFVALSGVAVLDDMLLVS